MASGFGLGLGAALGWGCVGPMLGCLGFIVLLTIFGILGAVLSNYATSPNANSATNSVITNTVNTR